MATVTLAQLEKGIKSQWCSETAWSPSTWSAADPAAGQCFSTAYVINVFLGGEIVYAEVIPHTQPKQRHAWNRLANGLEIDLTRVQFPESQEFLPCELPPDLVWQTGGTQAEALLARVKAKLNEEQAFAP